MITPLLGAVGMDAATSAIVAPLVTAGLGAGVSALAGGSPLTGALVGGGLSEVANAAGFGNSLSPLAQSLFGSSGSELFVGIRRQLPVEYFW